MGPCSDGIQDGDETGVDCGGSCGACDGTDCVDDGDCAGSCNHGVCAPVGCSDGDELFFDDFSTSPLTSSDWTTVSGTWNWDPTSDLVSVEASDGPVLWIGPRTWADYTLQVRMERLSTVDDSGIMFRLAQADPVNDHGSYYYFGLADGFVTFGYANGQWQGLATQSFNSSVNTFYTIEVDVRGSHFHISVDGEVLVDMSNTAIGAGSVGLRVFREPAAYSRVLVCP